MAFSWHSQSLESLLCGLKTSDTQGLKSSFARHTLRQYGRNRLAQERHTRWVKILLRQVVTPFVLILAIAVFIKYFISGWIEGSVILVTMILMILIGFIQEMKAETTLAALKKLSAHRSKVKRDGIWHHILSEDLVPGDLILLEVGDKVPADARLISASNLSVDESMLTGESVSVEKQEGVISQDTPLVERKNMVYSGTVVSRGKGEAIVVATGMQTEVGHIAKTIQEITPEPTLLEKDLHRIGKWIILLVFLVISIFFLLSIHAGMSWEDVFLLSVAAMVSAIPEGLPAAFAVTLAVGMHLMSKRNAIVRKMSAVETLGSTTIICSDKTGTLTCNQMTVTSLYVAGKILPFAKEIAPSTLLAYKIASLCNDAQIVRKKELSFLGDPTETALLTAAMHCKVDVESLYKEAPRIEEIPFASESRYMATAHVIEGKTFVYVKGAPETILAFSSFALEESGVVSLDATRREEIEKSLDVMTRKALRLIAVAYLELATPPQEMTESLWQQKLVFVGVFGMIDPPRETATAAISLCKKAQIRVLMMTGDNPMTAETIAGQIAIETEGVITGKELQEMDDASLAKALESVSVFARVEPADKFRIVRSLQAAGHIVAVTGDGINDAPALEAANIGIAMGVTGSDVAKESADMILTDDRFDSIVAAIEEGRAIFNRLRNICALLISTCFGEMIALIFCVGFLKVAPLLPAQILWLNLVAGSLVAIPLGLEEKTGEEMSVPPRDPKTKLLYQGMFYRILYTAIFLGGSIFGLFSYLLSHLSFLETRTIIFTAVILFEWIVAIEMRSDEIPSWRLNPFKNRHLMVVLLIVVAAHLIILYVPTFAFLFKTTRLTFLQWCVAFLPGLSFFILESLRKMFLPQIFNQKKWGR